MSELTSVIEKLYYKNSDDKLAEPMAKYMRNKFKFLGIPRPKRAEILKPYLKDIRKISGYEIIKFADFFWKKDEREFQYLALNILDLIMKNFEEKFFDYFKFLITNKSWWDTVDFISSHHIAAVYKLNPKKFKPEIIKLSKDENIWNIRTSIIFQLGFGKETDKELLSEVIKRNSGNKEFFIQKGIGWALRQVSYTDAKFVIDFVNETEMSNLAKREALKRINKSD